MGSERFFGTPERVPKVRNTFLERERGVSRNATGLLLDVSRQFDSLPLRPAAFIEPMECLAVPKVPEGSEWVYEIKLDGYRALAITTGGRVSARLESVGGIGPDIASAATRLNANATPQENVEGIAPLVLIIVPLRDTSRNNRSEPLG